MNRTTTKKDKSNQGKLTSSNACKSSIERTSMRSLLARSIPCTG